MAEYLAASTAADAPPRDVTAASRYENLVSERQPYLTRARECSALTIPSLIPPEGHNGATALYEPFQSVGADCVNNLAAKIVMTLFPPGTPFFRLAVDDFMVQALAQMAGQSQQGTEEDVRGDLEKTLGKIERSVVSRMEEQGARTAHSETAMHLIVAGNGLQYVNAKGKVKFFPLDRYVLCRDLDDNVLEIVVKECISRDALPPNLRDIIQKHGQASDGVNHSGRKDVDVYTWVQRQDNGSHQVHQEVCGEVVPGTEGTYPEGKSGWIPLRWTKVAGESYGRGRCEEYLADLRSLDSLYKSIVQFAAVAAKIIPLVDESGTTSKQQIAQAQSGDVLDGRASDVTFLQVDKGQDFQVARSVAEEVKGRLEKGFLSVMSIQRQAERVTAEEIRVMAGELDQGLGGTYSLVSGEWQRPLVMRYLHILPKDKKSRVPALPKGVVSPQIVTGLDGLGRNTDMQRLDALLQGANELFGQQVVAQYVNAGVYISRRGVALGVDMTGLVNSQDQVDAQNKQAQMSQMAQKLGGPAIKAVSDHMLAGQQQPPPQPGQDPQQPPPQQP